MNRTSRGPVLLAFLLLAIVGAPIASAADAAPKPATTRATPNWCTKVAHAPQQPKPNQPVQITASIADGATAVTLHYQPVDPGAYIELADPAYEKNWESVPMKPAGDATKGRTPFAAELPATLQKHRRLVRYRVTAQAADGKPLRWPVIEARPAAPPEPARPESFTNDAYFCYGDLPAWKGAIDPRSKDPRRAAPLTFPPAVVGSVQPYHLIGKKQSVENATWREQAGGKEYKYTGSLVADGVVFDHVRYRARGGVWRYAMGKNMWKFDLADGDKLKARDDFGRPHPGSWGKVNLRSIIQLGSYGRRGEQGLYESVGFRLFNLAGVPAPRTHYVGLRIINDADENPADQYKGDFWGLYLAIENEDGRFLKAHGLPDGNFYKMQNGFGELNNHGEGQPADSSDLRKFLDAYNGAEQTEDWWRKNLHLPSYYSYRSILECIHHYDVGEGKNYAYYHNPQTNQWHVIPWDLDLTWGDHMYGNGEEPFKQRVAGRQPFRREYFDRLREIRDLLYNPEQTGQLIDETAAVIAHPKALAAGAPTLAEADRRKWDHHPALAIGGQAGHGLYYQAAADKKFTGMVQQMKEYVKTRAAWIDANLADDKIPATPPAPTYAGKPGYATAGLKFRVGPFKERAAVTGARWRLAEITPDATWKANPRTPRAYEIAPVWESGELKELGEATIPPDAVKPGKTYRARVRTKDAAGRWSHWSAPLEFVAGK